MDSLSSAIVRFSTLVDRAAAELPHAATPGARIDGHWSKKEILGHLIDSAANNHQRFVRGQLDRKLASPSYAQKEWVEIERFQDREWSDLVQFWIAYNRHLLHIMSNAAPDRMRTPVSVGNGDPVTLEYIMVDYVDHLEHHLKQIAKG